MRLDPNPNPNPIPNPDPNPNPKPNPNQGFYDAAGSFLALNEAVQVEI